MVDLDQRYPAKAHCQKVISLLKEQLGNSTCPTLYLQGQSTRFYEDNDGAVPFRQRRHFLYLSGCLLPDCHLVYHSPTDNLTLFIPPLDKEDVLWSGLPPSTEEARKEYDIDRCLFASDLESHLKELTGTLFVTGRGDLPFVPTNFVSIDCETLHPVIDQSRVTKDAYEVALLRKANAITAEAHRATLRQIGSGSAKNETELEATFIGSCIAHGAKNQAYHGIFGSGVNAATLHYVHNDQDLATRRNILIDAGAEYRGYCADVTRTLPLGPAGFDKETAQIYVIVEKMQEACFKMLRADVLWEDIHLVAHEVAIEGLLSIGLLKGDKAEILRHRTSTAFFPHGLGHYLGLDTHDTGGKADYADPDPMFRYLRIRGTVPENAVVTVEPGVYFCRFIVEPYLKDEKHAQFINQHVLKKYWEVGGVRIEDDVLVTKDGYENLTTAPRRIEDMVDKIMQG